MRILEAATSLGWRKNRRWCFQSPEAQITVHSLKSRGHLRGAQSQRRHSRLRTETREKEHAGAFCCPHLGFPVGASHWANDSWEVVVTEGRWMQPKQASSAAVQSGTRKERVPVLAERTSLHTESVLFKINIVDLSFLYNILTLMHI